MSASCTRLEYFKRFRCPTYSDLGTKLGVTGNTARRYCQTESSQGWLWINAPAARELRAVTGGVIHAGNYSDEICEAEAVAMLAAIDAAMTEASAREVTS